MNNDCLFKDTCDNTYCVYKHTNIMNGKVYIGITCQDPKDRWNGGYGYCKNKYFWKSIQKYGWNDGFLHEVLYENLNLEEACEKEIELIAEYKSTNPRYGYNHHSGGQCHDYETRQKISENSANKKAVLQYSKSGKMIAEYESRSAASKATGISAQEIFLACHGKIFSAGGYFWCNKDDPEKIQKDIDRYRENMKSVLQFDLCGNLLFEYDNLYDASEKTGIDYYELFDVCFNKLNPLNNCLFCYEDKQNTINKWIKQNTVSEDTCKQLKIKRRHAGKRRSRN